MDRSDELAHRMPYLRAIQQVPGDTAGEKLSWINRCARQRTGDLENQQLPPELLPLYSVEVAVRSENHEEITAALTSEDLTLVNRALKAAWFFDGSHKAIVDDAYFVERVFPHVSAITRKRVVSALARRTINRDPDFAQRMFAAVESLYDIQTAYPLLIAAGEQFTHETIVARDHALPCRLIKKLWRVYPNLVVRYLKSLPARSTDGAANDRFLKPFGVTIHRYGSFLPHLVKKRTRDFAELCEINRRSLPRIKLSNTAAETFLKKGQSYFVKNPRLFIRMLPYKKINTELMKTVFPALLPEHKEDFNTDLMLDYLKYYPKDRKWELLCKSYSAAYGAELVDDDKPRNVTVRLMQLLPAEERVKLARFLIENDEASQKETGYEKYWISYLPADEAIPAIREKLSYSSDPNDRRSYILRMLYCCKINDDNDALANTLTYFLRKHKNEDSRLFGDVMAHIRQFFDVPHLNKKICSLIVDIAQLCWVKHATVNVGLIEDLVHHRLVHGMPIADLIKMTIAAKFGSMYLHFNMLVKYPEYERRCLTTFLELVEHEGPYKQREKQSNLIRLVEAMYDFNDRCDKSKTKIERLGIADYPWLMNEIKTLIQNVKDKYYFQRLRTLFKRKEPKLHDEWFPPEKLITKVTLGEALRLLARSPQSVANDWREYFERCSENCCDKFVQRFVKATRWHKFIPIAFAERSLQILESKSKDNDPSFATVALSLLLHGDSFARLIDPLVPAEITIDPKSEDMDKRYKLVRCLCRGMNLSNPPVPLDLVARLCRGDYLSVALCSVTRVSRRSSVPKVRAFAQNLLGMRVSARKHGITLMSSVISARERIDFLGDMWASEEHYSIRGVLFKHIHKLFVDAPATETWNLYAGVISTLNDKDVSGLFKPVDVIPHEYIGRYLEVWFYALRNVADTRDTIYNYLMSLEKPIWELLSEELVENVLKKLLFYDGPLSDIDTTIFMRARTVAIEYLQPEDKNKLPSRINMIMNIILDAVRNGWNVRLSDSSYYPVNIVVRELIYDLVRHPSVDMQVIDAMLTIFSSVLSPVQLPKSYLLLTYAKRLKRNCTPHEARDFGLKLGREITDSVLFSPLSVPFMADVLEQFLTCCTNWIDDTKQTEENEAVVGEQPEKQSKPVESDVELKLNVIEGLVEARNSYSCFMAVSLMSQESVMCEKYKERYKKLIDTFREMQDPAILIMLCYDSEP